MNKPLFENQIKSEESNVNQVNKNKRKSKFNKFFSTVTAVMIASSIAIGPMTLRGEETEKKDKKDVITTLEKEKEKAKKRIELIDEVAEARKKVAEYDKKEKEALELKAKYEQEAKEADKKILENCKGMKKNIVLATDYCSENKCTEQQLKILKETKDTYDLECKKLVLKNE